MWGFDKSRYPGEVEWKVVKKKCKTEGTIKTQKPQRLESLGSVPKTVNGSLWL